MTTLVAVTEKSVSLAGSVGCMRYGTVAIPLSVQQPTPVSFYRQKKHISTGNDSPSSLFSYIRFHDKSSCAFDHFTLVPHELDLRLSSPDFYPLNTINTVGY